MPFRYRTQRNSNRKKRKGKRKEKKRKVVSSYLPDSYYSSIFFTFIIPFSSHREFVLLFLVRTTLVLKKKKKSKRLVLGKRVRQFSYSERSTRYKASKCSHPHQRRNGTFPYAKLDQRYKFARDYYWKKFSSLKRKVEGATNFEISNRKVSKKLSKSAFVELLLLNIASDFQSDLNWGAKICKRWGKWLGFKSRTNYQNRLS